MDDALHYLTGWGNQFATEAIPGTLPAHQNAPQAVAHGLYAEQINGSAFTEPRHKNLRTWFYRLLPSVRQGDFAPYNKSFATPSEKPTPPNQMRWAPLPYPTEPTDFIDGWAMLASNGDCKTRNGAAIHYYACNQSMHKRYFYNADGELLVVPQEGELLFHTECGKLRIAPTEIIVIPRGIKFKVELLGDKARGYICENFAAPFQLPDLGPIGANGLANPRDFQSPVAAFEQQCGECLLLTKFHHHIWQAKLVDSPLNVVAWHGNYAPYKYDLTHFNTINTVSYDHPDPSIFTVLTAPTSVPGLANVDFVIFPERWMVAEHTFRPPYYHRNIMSEFMGLIKGSYDAKNDAFAPGGMTLHNCMSAHGPDADAYHKAIKQDLKPQRYQNTLAFMFESSLVWQPTDFALQHHARDKTYLDCWQALQANQI